MQHNQETTNNPWREFLQNSSIKGVPRILKSSNPVLRGIWVLAVFVFLIIAFYVSFQLVLEFNKYSVTTKIEEQVS